MEANHSAPQPTALSSASPGRARPFRKLAIVLVAIATALLALSLAGNVLAVTSSSEDEYPGVTRVELDLDASGAVEIAGTQSDQVQVERTVRSVLGSGPTVEEEQDGSTLRVQTRCQLPVVAFACGGVSYTLRVPADAVMVGSASNGSVSVAGVDGQVDLATSNGPIRVEGGAAPITLRSTNGRIEVDGTRAPRIDLATTNGDVSLASETAPDAITASATNGRIGIVVPSDAPPYAVEAETTNGRTDIGIATDPSATLTIGARTTNGDIKVENAP